MKSSGILSAASVWWLGIALFYLFKAASPSCDETHFLISVAIGIILMGIAVVAAKLEGL